MESCFALSSKVKLSFEYYGCNGFSMFEIQCDKSRCVKREACSNIIYLCGKKEEEEEEDGKFNKLLPPVNIKATAGGITKIPTNQSATAKLITKQLVTVRRRLVVSTDKITNVFPITVICQEKRTRKTDSHER